MAKAKMTRAKTADTIRFMSTAQDTETSAVDCALNSRRSALSVFHCLIRNIFADVEHMLVLCFKLLVFFG
jgi:hypothetical protein